MKHEEHKVYHRLRKWCDVCQNYTTQIVEAMVTVCTNCETAFDDDGDDLME